MSAIRVLIVDDSPFIRKALQRVLSSDLCIEVVGAARDGHEAVDKVTALKPDVVTLDIMMPGMDGLETLKVLMETRPTPVLMLSQLTKEGADLTLKALELGAMEFVDKSAAGVMDFFTLSAEIISKVKAIAGSKPCRLSFQPHESPALTRRGDIDVVAIGASTGGPPALQMILQGLPADIPFGMLIVQHMPHGFTGPLARRLDAVCKITVKEAEEGDRVGPGLALLAPSGLHMAVKRGVGTTRVGLSVEPMNLIHRPSVDILFLSVAKVFGERATGVILTGMGSDGAKGMKAIRDRGGATLAQNEATSVIFGMPKAALECGAVEKVVPITDMTDEILKRT